MEMDKEKDIILKGSLKDIISEVKGNGYNFIVASDLSNAEAFSNVIYRSSDVNVWVAVSNERLEGIFENKWKNMSKVKNGD